MGTLVPMKYLATFYKTVIYTHKHTHTQLIFKSAVYLSIVSSLNSGQHALIYPNSGWCSVSIKRQSVWWTCRPWFFPNIYYTVARPLVPANSIIRSTGSWLLMRVIRINWKKLCTMCWIDKVCTRGCKSLKRRLCALS